MIQKRINDFSSRRDSLFVISKGRTTQADDVLWAFSGCSSGATDKEVSDILGIERTSVIARRHDLIKKFPDLFYVDGKRLSKSGILCDVWKTDKYK